MNLYEVIKKNKYQGFGMLVVKRLVAAIVDCLRLLYVERIIHCDLKPVTVKHDKSRSTNSLMLARL